MFGRKVEFRSPADAIKSGIGMVHQHLKLVSDMTVTENIVLGLESSRGFLTDLPAAERKISELGERHGITINPKARIWHLSIGEKQRVEILKSLYRDARILILDEPTSVLAPSEVKGFFAALRNLKTMLGLQLSSLPTNWTKSWTLQTRVTVLRKGKNVSNSTSQTR